MRQARQIVPVCVIVWLTVTLASLPADEPEKFLLTGAEEYRQRALEEIRKAQPETDVSKLHFDEIKYADRAPANHQPKQETLTVTFTDPTKEKTVDAVDAHSVISTLVYVNFFHASAGSDHFDVQVHTGTTTQQTLHFGSHPASPSPSPTP